MSVHPLAARERPDYRHEAFFYADEASYLEGVLAFIRGGLNEGEAVLVASARDKIDLLSDRLGNDVDHVTFIDMRELGRNPARIIPTLREFAERHSSAGRKVRIIGEPVWAEREPAELVEAQRHEVLLNLAFEDVDGFWLLCPYDVGALDQDVIDEACRSHPWVTERDVTRDSHEYVAPSLTGGPFVGALEPADRVPARMSFGLQELSLLRAFLTELGVSSGLPPGRVDDFVLAVNELATNSVRYGGGGGEASVWTEGEMLICEVADRGVIDDPLTGRAKPSIGQIGGRGVYLVNQLCDLVQIRSGEAGNVTRIFMRTS